MVGFSGSPQNILPCTELLHRFENNDPSVDLEIDSNQRVDGITI